MGGGGRDGLGGLEGLQPPFAISGESLPFAILLSLDAAASLLSGPFELLLYRKQKAQSTMKILHRDTVLINSRTVTINDRQCQTIFINI